jgi:hypothetical protein
MISLSALVARLSGAVLGLLHDAGAQHSRTSGERMYGGRSKAGRLSAHSSDGDELPRMTANWM